MALDGESRPGRALRGRDSRKLAEIGRADEVLPAAAAKKPDVALLDIEMPGGDGLVAAAQLREKVPSCRVLMLTTFGRPGYLRRAMEGGAVGFLTKDAPAAQLALAIRRAVAGERVIDPQLAIDALSEGDNPLTEREQDVLVAASSGSGIAKIASTLHLSQGTVRNYLSLAIQKLDAANRFEAARIAKEKGWI